MEILPGFLKEKIKQFANVMHRTRTKDADEGHPKMTNSNADFIMSAVEDFVRRKTTSLSARSSGGFFRGLIGVFQLWYVFILKPSDHTTYIFSTANQSQ